MLAGHTDCIEMRICVVRIAFHMSSSQILQFLLVMFSHFGIRRQDLNNLKDLLLGFIQTRIVSVSPFLKCLINKNFTIRFHLIN